MSNSYLWLTAEQFSRLEPLLPSDTRGKPRVDDRRVISGIIHVLKSRERTRLRDFGVDPHANHALSRLRPAEFSLRRGICPMNVTEAARSERQQWAPPRPGSGR